MHTAELALKVDAFKAIRDKRLEMQKEVDQLESTERTLRQELVALLQEQGISAVGGKLATVSLVSKTTPTLDDFSAFTDYVRANNAFDLMHRRVSVEAVKARWDAGEHIPGVATITTYDLSVRKPK